MAAKQRVDYERIEPGWRAGLKSPAQLAAEYTQETGEPVSRAAIIKHFERLGIPRDLSAKIKAKADSMVADAMVTGKVSTATTAKVADIINTGATEIVNVRLSHRADIRRFKALVVSLLAECEAESGDPALFEELGEILRKPDDNQQDRLNDAYRKAISLPQRIKGVKELADTLKTMIALEREAWGLAAVPDEPAKKEAAIDPLEAARRVAFLLAKAAATDTTSRAAHG